MKKHYEFVCYFYILHIKSYMDSIFFGKYLSAEFKLNLEIWSHIFFIAIIINGLDNIINLKLALAYPYTCIVL